MKAPIAAAALVAALAGTALAHTAPHRLSEARILHIALAAARAAGDPTPTSIRHAAGTRARANLVDSGERVPGDQPSLLIVERGHFILKNAPVPPGAEAPHGSVLSLVVDARSGEITDEGVSDRVPDLRRLGPVVTDLAPALGCPAREPARVPRQDWAHELAPAGATVVTLCRYAGLDGRPPLALKTSSVLTNRVEIDHLVAALDALPPFPRGPVSCPADDGSAVLLRLRYPAHTLEVLVGRSGCRVARNGRLIRLASQAVVSQLSAARATRPGRAWSS